MNVIKKPKTISPPLKWHGGKHYLASKIVALMPPHVHYVEPYAGGLSVLLAKDPEGVSEVVNDINHDLWNFWQVLREPCRYENFKRMCEATPFSQADYNDCLKWRHVNEATAVDRAWNFFIRCRMSLAGRMKSFAPLSRTRTRRGMNEQASAWIAAVDGLPEVHQRLQRVVILKADAVKVIKQQDGPQTLFYCDPPYLHETRVTTDDYEHEMTPEQHHELLDTLAGIQGKFILSGYPSEMYDAMAERCGWHAVGFDLPNNSSSKQVKDRKTERLWMNYEPASGD